MTIQLTRRTVALTAAAFLALTAVATASLVLTLTGRAEANHRFNDIATGTFFHDSTAWLADHDIADGYNDGTFRPNNNITRGQAAYWFANYNNTIELVQTDSDPSTGSVHTQAADCPVGKRAVAGGGETSSTNLMMTWSYPPDADTWRVRWETDNNTQVDPTFLRAWALCFPTTIPAP